MQPQYRSGSTFYHKLIMPLCITILFGFSTPVQGASIITTNDGIWTSIIGFENMPHTGFGKITGEEYAGQGVHFSSNYIAYNSPAGNGSITWMGITGAHIGEAYGTHPITNTPTDMWIAFDYLVSKAGFNWRSNADVNFSIYNNDFLLDTFTVLAPGTSQVSTPRSFIGFTDDVFNKILFNMPDGYGMNLDNLSIQTIPAPPSVLLLLVGLLCLSGVHNRK